MATAARQTSANSWKEKAQSFEGIESIPVIEQSLSELTFNAFDGEIAFAIGELVRESYWETSSNTGILISIRLFSGLTLFQAACGPNVNPTNEVWVQRKYNTVREFGLPTLLKGRQLVKKGRSIDSLGPEFAAHGGAFPILIQSVGPIGAIIVSGLSQEMDHVLVVEAIRKFQKIGLRKLNPLR